MATPPTLEEAVRRMQTAIDGDTEYRPALEELVAVAADALAEIEVI